MHVVMDRRQVAVAGSGHIPSRLVGTGESGWRPQSTLSRPSEAGASTTPQGVFAGKRLVPKIVGSKSVGRLPDLICRLSDEDAARLRLRPVGGRTLRGAAPGDVILTTEAMVSCDGRTGEVPRDPLAWTLRAMLWVDLGDADRRLRRGHPAG